MSALLASCGNNICEQGTARPEFLEWDRIQKIAWEQEPFIYLVNKDALVAISPSVKNAQPSALRPQAYWNIDELALAKEAISK